jgi:membrane-associated phospholipid phosphatase
MFRAAPALSILFLFTRLAAQDPPQADHIDQDRADREAAQVSDDLRPGERDVSLDVRKFGSNLWSDQKTIWSFPQRNSNSLDTFNRVLVKNHTTAATLITPAAFYAAGLIAKDSYLKRTGLLAAEAWVDAEATNIAFRVSFRRLRPIDVPPNGSFSDTWFKTSANPLGASGSFPSGHTAWAFAVATVVARRHANHKWVPILAYSLATLDGISRISSNNHFLADTVFGGALGYAIGRYVVARQ